MDSGENAEDDRGQETAPLFCSQSAVTTTVGDPLSCDFDVGSPSAHVLLLLVNE